MFKIAITGTPGVGKTTLSKYLAKQLDFERLDVSDYYNKISVGYSKKKECYDIDIKKFEKLVKENIKENQKNKLTGMVIDSHISHLLSKKLVDLCVVLVCLNLKKLKKRLEKKGYSMRKVRENLDAEIFQICLIEAREKKHRIIVFDSGEKGMKEKVLKEVKMLR